MTVGIGDSMGGAIGTIVYYTILYSIQICTGLLVGLTLVGVDVQSRFKRLLGITLLTGILISIVSLSIEVVLPLVFIGILLIPIIQYSLKLPLSQTIVAVLLSSLFNLLVVFLLEYNLLELLHMMSGVQMDLGSQFSMHLLIALNNIFISMLMLSKKPIVFPQQLFEKQLSKDESEISFSGQMYFVVFMLGLLVVGLFYTVLELEYTRPGYRLFITIWSIAISLASIYFLRRIILYKNESIQVFLDRQYQKELLSFFQIVRSQRHDFNIHLTALYGLIQKGEYEACKAYIEDMTKSAANINDLLPLRHPAVSAMLSTFKSLAQEQQITIHYLLMDDLRNMPCSVYEMNKMLGNLIQNALDEVRQLDRDNRLVTVEISSNRNNIIMRVTNPTYLHEDKVHDFFAVGYSTKVNHEGLGLPMVKKIAEKYDGVIYPEILDGMITFNVHIPV
ncbi:GHKL domain-containing protein [Sporosarcina saromensis]|uniref:GHKL domain-containing protein n=1 Tax=Sporosarcina saromensis TaxID=359365 RepID=A0ABU4G7H1_9BACL|nr:GHKL domain-containing protein [Sporosarcina saromensis]MDW0112926.1 GHKL domain-containing protein [Sporosarcina saromensis]